MCYPFFFIKFLFPCTLVCKPLRKHVLPDQTRAGFLFNLIRNPCGYQYIGTSPFPDSFHFAKSHTIQNIIVTERHRHHPQNFGVGHAFFLLFHPRNSKLKNRTASWAGEFLDRIAFFAVYPSTIRNQLDECLSYSHVSHDFLKNRTPPQKNVSYSTKTPNSKKKKKFFRINIITNISKPRIKSSVNGFRQISQYEQEKKNFLMSPLNSN